MEVHHHPQVEKKRFKEYFLEFLMIFLAVTLGFFAENIREHSTETVNGKRYLEAYRDELVQQYYTMNVFKKTFQRKMMVCDSMKNIFYLGEETKKVDEVRKLLLPCLKVIELSFHTSAYQQMVNSGALRYIKNVDLRDSMAVYNSLIETTLNYTTQLTQAIIHNTAEVSGFFDFHDVVPADTTMSFEIEHHIPDVEVLTSLTTEQRNRIVFFWESYVVQARSDLGRIRSLEAANQHLLQMVNERLEK